MHNSCTCTFYPPSSYSLKSPLSSLAPSPCSCNSPDLRFHSPALPPFFSPSPTPAFSSFPAPAPSSSSSPTPLNPIPKIPPSVSVPKSATSPPWASGSAARKPPPPWSPPRRLAAPLPISGPVHSPAPIPFAISKAKHHNHAIIAGAAASAAFLLCVGTIFVLAFFLRKKKLPQCIMRAFASMNSPKSRIPVRSEQPSSSRSENTKKDAVGDTRNEKWDEEHVVVINKNSTPERGRRRSPMATTGESTFKQSVDKQNIVEEVAAVGAPDGLRGDAVGKSGRKFGERNRDAKSVRTKNFASLRTDRDS